MRAPADRHHSARYVLVLGVLALGLVVGVLAGVEHRMNGELFGRTLPWGLALAVVGSWVVAAGAGRLLRLGSAWFTVGWATVLVLQQSLGRGSYLVADDAIGWTYVLAGLGGLLVVVVRDSRVGR